MATLSRAMCHGVVEPSSIGSLTPFDRAGTNTPVPVRRSETQKQHRGSRVATVGMNEGRRLGRRRRLTVAVGAQRITVLGRRLVLRALYPGGAGHLPVGSAAPLSGGPWTRPRGVHQTKLARHR